jgi:CDP-glucose 4,6-dehydratase
VHFLITGHTGFKGSWLSQLLANMGHSVSGVSLDPKDNELFVKARLSEILINDFRQDIRNFQEIDIIFQKVNPDIVIHLAAQPLVLESYRDPVGTFETNVIGTMNILRASDNLKNLRARLIVTTDKVYKNDPKINGYKEDDALGGADPYSASKAMADILTQSWMSGSPNVKTAIARAGNVIGGGDVAKNRIMTDFIDAIKNETTLEIRYPRAVRPWQHVLDCLSGYLCILDKLISNQPRRIWNIGPTATSYRDVSELVSLSEKIIGKSSLKSVVDVNFKETEHLTLDARMANSELGWENRWDFEETVKRTVNWYKKESTGLDPRQLCERDILDYISDSRGQTSLLKF